MRMLMGLRSGGNKSNANPFSKKSPKVAKPSRKLKIFIPEDPTNDRNNGKETSPAVKKSHKIQASVIKNNVNPTNF